MKQFLLICGLVLILFMTGCASVHTWQATGYEVFQPESHHLEKLPDGRILLTQQGMVKEYYLPFFDCFAVESEQERKRYFSVNDDHDVSPRTEVVIKFRVKKNAKNVGENYAGGVLFPFTTLQLQEIPVISPQDKELLLTKPVMFLDSFYEPELFILTEYEQKSDELLLGKGHVFYSRLHSEKIGNMEGAGFTCLRLLMMPIPVVIDIATFPFQFVALFLLH